ncbi:MAG TPA: SoxR reducing system RseC family protein [Candidatus Krumholzibacteria bacterium]|nr:SoxR reducing system RseC family protein [Candidatus Krumholzibacteria bacterium]HPD70517.1 SoxR reducing system RseC family protein [Candidatus Krumholzibacteria bacterium]HRY39783.1 SoxR reducing system RseC family protein [Candidatus Krumholzibacteria bacterium]
MATGQRGEVLLEEGVVLALIPAAGGRPARVRVRLEAGEHCEGCSAHSLCKPDSGDRRLLDAIDQVGVTVGDRVRVAVPGGAVLRVSLLVYGLPLLLLLVGAAAGARFFAAGDPLRDLWSFLLGIALAGAALPLVRRAADRTEAAGGQVLEARVEGIVREPDAGAPR